MTDDEIKADRAIIDAATSPDWLVRCVFSSTDSASAFVASLTTRWPAALDEVERLRKLFEDAGQGEHNVLALIDHYQREAQEEAERRRAALDEVERLRGERDQLIAEGRRQGLLEASAWCSRSSTEYARGAMRDGTEWHRASLACAVCAETFKVLAGQGEP